MRIANDVMMLCYVTLPKHVPDIGKRIYEYVKSINLNCIRQKINMFLFNYNIKRVFFQID